jgi:multiple sugar transport system permease protein
MTTDLRRKLVVFASFLVTGVTLIPVVMMVLVAFQSDAESMAATSSAAGACSSGSTSPRS